MYEIGRYVREVTSTALLYDAQRDLFAIAKFLVVLCHYQCLIIQ